MAIGTFEIISIAVIFVLALLPILFLFCCKRHPEKLTVFLDFRNRPKGFYRFALGFIGFSLCCTHIAAYSIVFSVTAGILPGSFIISSISGVAFCIWLMYALLKRLNKNSCSTIFISEILFSTLFSLSFLSPVLFLSESLHVSDIVHTVSFFSLAISAIWMNFHLSKLSEKNEAASKIVPVSSTDDPNMAAIPPKEPVPLQNSSLPTESPIDESSPISMTSENTPISLAKRPKYPFIKWIVFVAVLSCFIGIVIGYLAGGGYLSPDFVPDSPYIDEVKKQAASEAYSHGYDFGYDRGKNAGFLSGQDSGYDTGYKKGYSDGYDEGASNELALLLDDYFG